MAAFVSLKTSSENVSIQEKNIYYLFRGDNFELVTQVNKLGT
jgi:hypothetical protein